MNVQVQFDPELDFFLERNGKRGLIDCSIGRNPSAKDIIESMGVPHTEVGHILFQDREVRFAFVPKNPGVMRVLGVAPPMDVTRPTLLRPRPMDGIRFIADVNVMKLGRLMRLLGFDTDLSPDYDDGAIADKAQAEGRIVLTRDTGLLKRKKIVFARRIRADLPYDQLAETIRFFGLGPLISFFSRCSRCNVPLAPREKKEILHLLEPKTRKYFHSFFQCPRCGNVFWRGSHYDHILEKFAGIGISLPD